MAYEAKRNEDLTPEEQKEQQKQENHEANKKAVSVGLDAGAKYAPGWIGTAFKAASAVDKATNTGDGGIVSKVGAYGADIGNKFAPGVQKATNLVANSEVADMAYDAYNAKNSKGASVADKAAKAKDGAEKVKEGAEKAKDGADKAKQAGDKAKEGADKAKQAEDKAKKGGEQGKSLPSSGGENEPEPEVPDNGGKPDKKDSKTTGLLVGSALLPIVLTISPLFLILLLFLPVLSVVNNYSDYEDAFGISETAGLNTGGINGSVNNASQEDFYKRIMDVKSEFADDGKKVDPLLVVAVFHAVNVYGADVSYDDMTKMRIQEIAGSMFDEDGKYNKELFIENLKEFIIPDYLEGVDDETKEAVVNEVFDYIARYYALIGGSSSDSGEAAGWKQYEGEWSTTEVGNSGSTVKEIGCLVTSIAIQISRSGVQTGIPNFNPGTFVEALNDINAFGSGGELLNYSSVTTVVPNFKYQGYTDLSGMGKEEKLETIKNIVNQTDVYAVAEVKGDTGQHWVAIESVNGDTINMLDPGSSNTDMWSTYGWVNTSRIVYYKAG